MLRKKFELSLTKKVKLLVWGDYQDKSEFRVYNLFLAFIFTEPHNSNLVEQFEIKVSYC